MHCPSCHTAILDATERCPACGNPLHSQDQSVTTLLAQAEAGGALPLTEAHSHEPVIAERASATAENAKNGNNGNAAWSDNDVTGDVTTLVVQAPISAPVPLVKRIPELTALAWRQPSVRAAVKTSASTLALTIALNVARRTLAARGARATAPSLPSVLLETLSSGGRRPGLRRPGRAVDSDVTVEEVVIYARRVTRR